MFERRDLIGAAGRAGRESAGRGVRQPLNDEPPERRGQLTQPRQLNLIPPAERLIDQPVQHRRLGAEDARRVASTFWTPRPGATASSAGTSALRIRPRAYASESLVASSRHSSPRSWQYSAVSARVN